MEDCSGTFLFVPSVPESVKPGLPQNTMVNAQQGLANLVKNPDTSLICRLASAANSPHKTDDD
jgi:hypothetical protein